MTEFEVLLTQLIAEGMIKKLLNLEQKHEGDKK